MKRSVFILSLILSVFIVNCNKAPEGAAAIVADQELALKVEGMVCAVGCAKYIEKEVAKMDGIKDCVVDFEQGTASITFSSTAQSADHILETINGLNDGQYKVIDVQSKKIKKTSADRSPGAKEEESSVTDVKFNFPELVTFFIGELTR